MRLKTLVITVAILAILSGAVYFIQRPKPTASADARVGQPLADRATVEKAQKLRLTNQSKTVLLTRQPDATWRVATYYDFPADFQKLTRFVGDLTDAKLQRFVTANPERIARLEFKDTKIELLDSGDKPVWSVTLGKNADAGGRFIRFDAEEKAYLTNLSAWIDSDSKNWADAQILSLKPDEIAKVELTFPATNLAAGASEPKPSGPVAANAGEPAATTLTLSRAKKEDPWTADKTPPNQRVKSDKMSSVLTSVGTIRFSDTLDLTDPKVAEAKPHARTFKLTTFDGKTYTVTFARKPEEKKLKPPTPGADGKSGPAALGTTADLSKNPEPGTPNQEPSAKPKPLAPEFETIPAGPVFVTVASSDPAAPVNALMQKRAFEVSDYTFTGLPQSAADLFESVPTPAPAKSPAASAGPPQRSPAKNKP